MREIKFRGKRIDNNEWIYGYLLYDYDMADDYVPFIIWKDERYLGGSGEEQIIEHTIGQYTGLKDKNGKEVYIGDILEYTFTDYKGKELWTENYIVKENISGWEMRNITKPKGHRSLSLVKNYEVIGNIYDNPELLEV